MIRLKQEHLLIIVLIVLIIGSGLGFLIEDKIGDNTSKNIILNKEKTEQTNTKNVNSKQNKINNPSKIKTIIVYITGGVENCGVYELSEKSRVVDALQAAGGQTEKADLSRINLAAPIYDGDRIDIPLLGSARDNLRGTINPSQETRNKKININRADKNELQKLSGIGPSKAESIIDYRGKVGKFTKLVELLNVSGIGQKTLEKIKDKLVLR